MEFFLSAFVTLNVVIDPLGTAAVFAALTSIYEASAARQVALRATLIGTGVLLFFALFGAVVLKGLGISLEAFRVAGGLLLFVTAFRMLMGAHDQQNLQNDNSVYADRSNIAVFPLAIPLLSGPGCITAIILLMGKAHTPLQQGSVVGAMLLAMLIAYVSMLAAAKIARTLGQGGIQIAERLMGMLLAALAVQFIADGALVLFKGG